MNHQPFETWLLNEQPLSPEQQRDLQAHLRTCEYCTALAEVNLALHSAKMAAPAPGFTARFQKRLEAQRALERRNRLIGMLVLVFGVLGLTIWLIAPWLMSFLNSPAAWISTLVGSLLSVFSMMQAIGELGSILLQILPGFIPPLALLIGLSILSGFGLLWTISIWRFTRFSVRSVHP